MAFLLLCSGGDVSWFWEAFEKIGYQPVEQGSRSMKRVILFLIAGLFIPGCALDYRQPLDVGIALGAPVPIPVHSVGPPPWVSAYGYDYYYYPDVGAYYSLATGMYFYMDGGVWQLGVALPLSMSNNPGGYVSLHLPTSRPYLYYGVHDRRYRGWRGASPIYGRSHGYSHGHRHGYWR